MAEYKILFVDEVEADINRFLLYINRKDENEKFEAIGLTPENTLDNFMDQIRYENFDAIITDHKLNEYKSSIEFDGIELVRRILEEKEEFPCFILTSWDKDAVENGDDPNMVYLKNFKDPDGLNHATFLDKIENKIKQHRKSIKNAEQRILELITKSKTESLNAEEEAELLKYDAYIIKTSNVKSLIPKHLKGTKNLDELHKMIKNTDNLLQELRENLNDDN